MNDWDLSNIRADIMLATDIEHLQAIDNYYENIINNLQFKIDKAIEFIKEKGCYYSGDFDDILDLNDLDDLLNILQGDDK